jgi:UDP-glucose 4-epimerase
MNRDYGNSNCVVTGGGGFLGQNIVSELHRRGANVVVLDNFSYGASPATVGDGVKIINNDVRDSVAFSQIPDDNYHYFFHFAAPSSIVLFNQDPHNCVQITTEGFNNAVDWCVNNNVQLIYPSSGSIYSGTKPPNSENSDLSPRKMNAYAKTKRSLELIHQSHMNELDAVGLRIFAGYGPSEKQKGNFASVIHMFARDILNDEPPVVYGDGTQSRDFVYETDVARATLAIGQEAEQPIVNIGSGSSISFNKLIEIINKLAGKNICPEYTDSPNDYLRTTEADTTRMKQYYSPQHDIKDGIGKVINSLR